MLRLRQPHDCCHRASNFCLPASRSLFVDVVAAVVVAGSWVYAKDFCTYSSFWPFSVRFVRRASSRKNFYIFHLSRKDTLQKHTQDNFFLSSYGKFFSLVFWLCQKIIKKHFFTTTTVLRLLLQSALLFLDAFLCVARVYRQAVSRLLYWLLVWSGEECETIFGELRKFWICVYVVRKSKAKTKRIQHKNEIYERKCGSVKKLKTRNAE